MKIQLASSQKVKVRVLEYEPSDIATLASDTKALEEITTAVNADRRQKEALVQFRDDLSTKIAGLGFKRKTTTVTKDNETVEQPDETEGEHIGRFVDALTTGEATADGYERPSGDDKAQEVAALGFLQTLAFQCGDQKDSDGNPCYVLDISRPVRVSTGKAALPKWALEAAGNIIKNGSQQKWIDNFTKGYTSASGVVIDPIPFESFTQHVDKHASAEQKEQVHQSNVRRLALAIRAVRQQEDAKRAPEFV